MKTEFTAVIHPATNFAVSAANTPENAWRIAARTAATNLADHVEIACTKAAAREISDSGAVIGQRVAAVRYLGRVVLCSAAELKSYGVAGV